jgi:hypothetical protein
MMDLGSEDSTLLIYPRLARWTTGWMKTQGGSFEVMLWFGRREKTPHPRRSRDLSPQERGEVFSGLSLLLIDLLRS